MINDINKYIEDVSGNVYKIIDSHFLNLSPCKQSKKYVNEMDDDLYHYISYNNAMMIINKQYNSINEKWKFEGKNYLAKFQNIETKNDIDEHTFRIKLLPDHSVVLDDEGLSLLKMIRHKGKMYYILILNEHLPRVKAYDLFGKFAQWVGIQNCKPCWNEDDKKFM